MNDAIQNRRLGTRETVLSKDTPSIESLSGSLFKYSNAVRYGVSTATKQSILGTGMDYNTAMTQFHAILKRKHIHENDLRQQKRVYETYRREGKQYSDMTAAVESEIQGTKDEIEILKLELQKARVRREEKVQMEAKCKEINKYPSRKALEKSIDIVSNKIASIRQELDEAARENALVVKNSKAFFKTFTKLVDQLELTNFSYLQAQRLERKNSAIEGGDDEDEDIDDEDKGGKDNERYEGNITGKKRPRGKEGATSSAVDNGEISE